MPSTQKVARFRLTKMQQRQTPTRHAMRANPNGDVGSISKADKAPRQVRFACPLPTHVMRPMTETTWSQRGSHETPNHADAALTFGALGA